MSRLLPLLVISPALLLSACAASGPGDAVVSEAFPDDRLLRGSTWPFQPTRMRIHPLTRILSGIGEKTGEQEFYIELMLELLDQYGHSTKGLGELRFELHSADVGERSDRLLFYRLDLNDMAVNAANYDWVTRMYRINLVLPRALIAQHPRLRLQAFMLTPEGRKLQHEALLDRARGGE